MSDLTLQTWTMPGADLGPENPLTPLQAYLTASTASAGAGVGDYPDRGQEAAILPYRLQDGYDRRRRPRDYRVAVLENRYLRATFLLDLGGRLWSLWHKPTHRELLFVNPVFQPANLAVRDAWFCGGVEWNISIIGHGPFTCSPLFAARVLADDGTPVLRLYEWDRVRGVPFQLDCWLPADSSFLMVRVQLTNPNDHVVPMYWWSNIAVPERADVRVIGPATKAYRHDYDGRLLEHTIPMMDGVDVSYTTNRRSAADLYFQIPQAGRPWITALDGKGRGLIQTSTDRLRGRKMFNWGMDPGGQRWQEFLAEPGQAYIEIQGGLARTQGEYLAMPAGAEWSWLEAYGLLETNPAQAHSSDWSVARTAVEIDLERALPRQQMDALLEQTAKMANRAPVEILHEGSGWGALELRRRLRSQEPPFATAALPFPDRTLGDEQQPWLTLLHEGRLPSQPAAVPPRSLMVQPQWRELLERSADTDAHWLTWYHLGVMRYRAGDRAAAKDAWERSLQQAKSPWAYRDLAVLAQEDGDAGGAADLWLAAARMAPQLAPLAIECARALLKAGRYGEQTAFIESLSAEIQANGRIRLLRALGALKSGDLAAVQRFYDEDFEVPNIREMETSLSDLWFGWQEQRLARELGVEIDLALRQRIRREFPPPQRFDFRSNSKMDFPESEPTAARS